MTGRCVIGISWGSGKVGAQMSLGIENYHMDPKSYMDWICHQLLMIL